MKIYEVDDYVKTRPSESFPYLVYKVSVLRSEGLIIISGHRKRKIFRSVDYKEATTRFFNYNPENKEKVIKKAKKAADYDFKIYWIDDASICFKFPNKDEVIVYPHGKFLLTKIGILRLRSEATTENFYTLPIPTKQYNKNIELALDKYPNIVIYKHTKYIIVGEVLCGCGEKRVTQLVNLLRSDTCVACGYKKSGVK